MSHHGYTTVPYNDGTELTSVEPAWKTANTSTTDYPPLPDNSYATSMQSPYQPYAGADPMQEPLKPEHHLLHHWESEKPPIVKTILVQLFALLWLAPIVALLYLNIHGYVLGASAWCPLGKCDPETWINDRSTVIRRPAEFDKDSHNLLGSLQLVAKALEVWFMIIAGWLVYLVTMILAGRRTGLPIGYLSRIVEWSAIEGLIDPLLWTALRTRRKLWIYVLGTVILCIIANLMGPAVAVLLIPTLQWQETSKIGQTTFSQLNVDGMLADTGFAWDTSPDTCTKENYFVGNFSCNNLWATDTDALVEQYLAAQVTYTVLSTQDRISYSYNTSESSETQPRLTWIPSRQIMGNVSSDLDIIIAISSHMTLEELDPDGTTAQYLGGEDILQAQWKGYQPLTQTVQTFLQRNGPILGVVVNYWSGSSGEGEWETVIDSSRAIRCYENWNISNSFMDWGTDGTVGTYTRCIELGDGWNDGSIQTKFNIDPLSLSGPTGSDTTPGVDFSIIRSGRVAFLPDGNLPSGFPTSCLPKDGAIGTTNATSNGACDWDAFFASGQSNPLLAARSRNVTTYELFWDPTDVEGHPTNISIAVDFSIYQSMAVHSLDTSWITNQLLISNFELLNDTSALNLGSPLAVDPMWSLAAFAVDDHGVLDPSRRSVGARMLDLFNSVWATTDIANPLYYNMNLLEGALFMPIIELLSLVDHNTALSSGDTGDPAHPLLQSNARVYVWAWSISSRTAYMGVIVLALGCVVVLIEVMVGMWDRRRFASQTQQLVSALEHIPNEEFRGIRDEETISRIPFRLTYEPALSGRFKFQKIQ